jgi:hypothetical protein
LDRLGGHIGLGLVASRFENLHLTSLKLIELFFQKIALLFAPFGKLI